MLLALLPGGWLRRWFWVVSPAIDCTSTFVLWGGNCGERPSARATIDARN
jgi:hypothetical protein